MIGARSVYRAMLYVYPAAFRHEYGNQMLIMFAEQLGEARRAGGVFQPAALWLQAAGDTVTVAPKEHCHVIAQDLRYALRTMMAKPGFAAVAVLSLALGIGANTALFSLWNGALHASLPGVARPEQLVMLSDPDMAGMWRGRLTTSEDGPRPYLSWGEFEQLRDQADCFSGLMATQSSLENWHVRADGGEHEAIGRLVSGGYFQVLGVSPAMGRFFTVDDDRIESPYAVLSYSYWQNYFGGSPDVLGKAIALDHAIVTVIGVAPRGFFGETSGQQPDLWLPLRMQPRVLPPDDYLHDTPPSKTMWLHVFGRLKPGVTRTQAEAKVNAIFQAGLIAYYGPFSSEDQRRRFLDQRIQVRPGAHGASSRRNEFSGSLNVLLAAVGVLLLIACANLANLMLARGAGRKPEIALRLSLGASRGRIIRQLVTESFSLAVVGGVAGLFAAALLHGAMVRMLTESDPDFRLSFSLDPAVLAFAAGATLIAAVLFGVLPAFEVTRTGAGAILKEQSRGAKGSLGQMRFGRLLVCVQLALSLPLLAGAGLLVRTFYNLQHADLGFPSERLLMVRVDLRQARKDYVRLGNLRRAMLEEIERIPGVKSTSFSQLGIMSGGESSSSIRVEGDASKENTSSALDDVGPRYFSGLGIPIVMGREILESDSAAAPRVCVINEAFARRFFTGRNPIGMHISTAEEDHPGTVYTVVGVAKNARTESLRGQVAPRFFVSADQPPASSTSPTFLIRTATDSAPVLTAARKAIERVDASMPIESARSLAERLLRATAQDRTTARLAVAFGCVALALAAIGLYGVLSYGIARRSGEIAVRIALGARPGRVVGMILRETSAMVVAGLVLGGGLAYAASALITSRLYGIDAQDPLTLGAAVVLLLAVALSAAYLPARRASKVDPMAGLRQE